ncbi:uncharacterized protein I303_105264 [Kwoniella dejecticola CBS 10117]|uniref:histidine kinase n=1 Tax=Kwoniella dejecticola CBS 10117 TaxID=1296121 RepID=A0A1A6A303_9TREE|nr:uncharacterized protein I303_05288 [Kwoniella dejecticola CBS 10117]OBR84430.1 hypothetical protein I303_05288 [Kwoniella dejecticola CBS 10117]
MSASEKIPFSETAPTTVSEWEQALRCYARDRENRQRASFSGTRASPDIHRSANHHWSASQPPPTQGDSAHQPQTNEQSSKPPLIHHGDSDDSMDAGVGGVPFTKPENIPGPFRPIETATEVPPSIQQYDNYNPSFYESSDEHWHNRQHRNDGEQSLAVKHNMSAIEPIPLAFDTARTVPQKRSDEDFDSDDFRSAKRERKRMEDFYKENGWLPGPVPNKLTRLKRRRAIRRLGLVGEEEDGRKSVLSKYAEMAELIFDVKKALVSVIHDEVEYAYFGNVDRNPVSRPTPQTACSHVIDIHDGECWVIADVTKDWRTRNNPLFKNKASRFFAAAPLRYHGKDGSIIDFGTLNIYDENPRYSFTYRERAILLKLANMLVYQLATLQSEYMAKRSSAMYGASISFLRRSFIPDPSESQSREHRRSSRLSTSTSVSAASLPSPRPALPLPSMSKEWQDTRSCTTSNAVKKFGPRGDSDARRQALHSDRHIFDDAANTLKVLLKADAVVVLNMEDYQLFIRKGSATRNSSLDGKTGTDRIKTKEKIIKDYLQGDPWPENVEPVISYVGKRFTQAEILGSAFSSEDQSDNEDTGQFRFNSANVEDTLSRFLKTYLARRQFWWDREETQDALSAKIMDLMPCQAQTALGTTFLGYDGKIKFVMFATWDRPPSSLVDSSLVALPFVWILGGCLMAALAMKKIRALEQSQINYSNLQAHELRTPLHQILGITQLLRSSMSDLAEPTASSLPTSQQEFASAEQIRDLVPFLDAIDTSGKTLHGIVDNILSFLDLKGKETSASFGEGSLFTAPTGDQTSIEVMFEEIVEDVIQADQSFRKANGSPHAQIETIFEIIPPLLGEQVSEDAGGALRRALTKVLSNAYKFIETDGCVEIYVDDVIDLLPPEGCEDIALTKAVSITIKDDGKGMGQAFVNEKLGQPWAKEDRYVTGSGLSVHLAYRIIDLLGGCMEITSAPGEGTTVQIDVPLPLRSIPFPEVPGSDPDAGPRRESAESIRQLTVEKNSIDVDRKVCLIGWAGPRIDSVGKALRRQYAKLGCEIVTDIQQAQLVIACGKVEEDAEVFEREISGKTLNTHDIVFLIADDHQASPQVLELEKQRGYEVRRFKRPTKPSILRETLFPNHSVRLQELADADDENGDHTTVRPPPRKGKGAEMETLKDQQTGPINTPHLMSPDGRDIGEPFEENGDKGKLQQGDMSRQSRDAKLRDKNIGGTDSYLGRNKNTVGPQNPARKVDYAIGPLDSRADIEDMVADLSLGMDPSVKPKQQKTPIRTREGECDSELPDAVSTEDAKEIENGSLDPESQINSKSVSNAKAEPKVKVKDKDKIKVLVVEDNKINRTILVKILSGKLPSFNTEIEVHEAEDGDVAVEIFRKMTSCASAPASAPADVQPIPMVVLLDINMPRKDGYQTCVEMRSIENENENERDNRNKSRSQIIAVTALGSEEEKRKGLVECKMDKWYTKPCNKETILRIVREATEVLLGDQ